MRIDITIPRTKVDYFTYESTEELERGDLVLVPIRNKLKYGIIINKNSKREVAGIKRVKGLVETKFIPEKMLELYEWMSDYYLSPLGDVLKLAIPSKILKKFDYIEKREPTPAVAERPVPNRAQAIAIDRMQNALTANKYAAFLLYGITGSGKTEVYLRCVEKVIRNGGRALVLVPEISMTPLLFQRFEERFQNEVVTIHSTLTDKERRQLWYSIKAGKYRVVIGPRSTVFIPMLRINLDRTRAFIYTKKKEVQEYPVGIDNEKAFCRQNRRTKKS